VPRRRNKDYVAFLQQCASYSAAFLRHLSLDKFLGEALALATVVVRLPVTQPVICVDADKASRPKSPVDQKKTTGEEGSVGIGVLLRIPQRRIFVVSNAELVFATLH
jgi:hypothetical protein